MKEIIERIKSQNGNESLTQKDLLWYLVGRVDDLVEKKVSTLTFWSMVSIILALLGGLATYVLLV